MRHRGGSGEFVIVGEAGEHIATREGDGHSVKEGDERTPEARYVLDPKNARSAYYKSIHISYPQCGAQ